MVLYTLHLFSGAGGGILADLLLGHRPIGAVEIEPYAREVLLCRQADGSLPRFPIWDDVCAFRADNPETSGFIERLRGIRENLCISGGFPCQDISSAGKRAGITGERSGLWKEFARIIGEIRPKYAFLENSPLLVRNGLDVVVTDLASMGYSLAWGIISAEDVGAPHKRKRFWGLAISDALRGRYRGSGSDEEMEGNTTVREREISNANGARRETINADEGKPILRPSEVHSGISNSLYNRNVKWLGELQKDKANEQIDGRRKAFDARREWWKSKSRLDGMANGISDWLDENRLGTLWQPDEKGIPRIVPVCKDRTKRLKAIGNGQVPLCAAVAWEILKEILESYAD